MSLFQNNVVQQYLKSQDKDILQQKWDQFQAHFHQEAVQENIRNSKEEQYQEGFLRDLFVQVLGYTLNPAPDFNLTTEYKNVKDAKKADGAIIINDKVLAVIELKGTDTTDLGKVEIQAFGYKNNQPDCKYVIISNFEKLRFYIDNAIEHIEWNLFELKEEDFQKLYLCLAHDNLQKGIPGKIKNDSVSREDNITKELYKDYSNFKTDLFEDLKAQNPQYDELTLFKKSQKLLDRLLFICFAEDRGLLPPNSIYLILEQWQKLKDLDEYRPLYDRFKKYFGYMNTGHKGQKHDVFAYNGGLFQPDEVLDNISINDELLYKYTKKISEYDFESEVDVNILGHIFEHSLNEIDEITARIEGREVEKSKTKRKKDGVFYTPKYITKYIVENTVGKLCEEKKQRYKVEEELYTTDKKRSKKIKQELLERLKSYREWLLQITVVDPACGSGSFLNEALNFLIDEHAYIDELEAKLMGDSLVLSNVENSILENNLFGVDLNEESVEIAKLSLWLRTAQPHRKLNDLNSNLKCGNSLIDDPEIAGELAFKWEEEFPQVFKEKNAYHLVFTTHNSRTSQRMRNLRIYPGKPALLNLPQEIQLAKIFRDIIRNYDLEVLAWNVCKDHVHLILVCTEDEIHDQVRIMKSISSRELNRWVSTVSMGQHPLGRLVTTRMGADIKSENIPTNASNSKSPIEHGFSIDSENAIEQDSLMDSESPIKHSSPMNSENPIEHGSPMGVESSLGHDSPMNSEDPIEHGSPMGLDPLPYNPEEHDNHLWSQKFYSVDTKSWKWISAQEEGFPYRATHLENALAYIESNRHKHNLPISSELEEIIASFVKTPESVFKNRYKGGFDVVIGNPPYVKLETIKDASQQLEQMDYQTFDKRGDLYVLFVEKGFDILKPKGKISYIMPNKWLQAGYGEKLRSYFLAKDLEVLIDFGDIQIFEGATTYPVIFIANNLSAKETFRAGMLKKELMNDFLRNVEESLAEYKTEDYSGETWVISSLEETRLLDRLNKKFPSLKEYVNGEANYGIKPGLTEAFIIDEETRNEIVSNDLQSKQYVKPFLQGRDIKRYTAANHSSSMIIIQKGETASIHGDLEEQEAHLKMAQSLPGLFNWLNNFEEKAKKRTDKGDYWWELRACDYYKDFESPKIMYQVFQVSPCFIYDESGLYCNNSMWILPTGDKGLLAILNSKLGWWLITKYCTQIQNGHQLIWKYFGQIPIAPTNDALARKADLMLSLHKDLQSSSDSFIRFLQGRFPLEKISKKLETWYELDYKSFLSELKKQKIQLSMTEEKELGDLFLSEQQKAMDIRNTIDRTDHEIDRMVYELYGLTDEEIGIVES